MELEMESQNTHKNASKSIECPSSPVPDDFELPSKPADDYYKKIPQEQLDLIGGIRTKDLNAASEKREDETETAKNAYQTAQDAYEKAVREKDSAIKGLETKSKNKKTELLRVYKENLVKLLPKGCAITGKDNLPLAERVPPDKLALHIAELKKSLADEDLDYTKKLKEIKVKLAEAENLWAKARIDYESADCEIKFTEAQAIKQADVVWQTSLSKLVEQYK
ncbi:hypothetical protein [Nitrosomonas sp. Nm166]|uniref:hypothetical protein n=1 Tax=Nitrosomonas sp. Nm166 TaxID=1881054 RepID=UPI0008E0522B|nr:hypothetical protein [Nitrosomonas sp. Nm166]SFE85431.1 hypothetical protein SAMN05428977_103310 [Nitrosomonas sp. Nm166]